MVYQAVLRCVQICPKNNTMNLIRKLQRFFHVIFFTIKSLTYDATRTSRVYFDAALEPLFWIIDKVTSYFGVVMVVMVVLLTSSVVVLWYLFLLPVILSMSQFWIVFHCVLAHYLLINIVFHYFMAVCVSSGKPPEMTPMEKIKGAVVCKKCVQPKPPRTHHCTICNCCFLKMDHHCPWMNNCIGFYNHRFFVSFCVFMLGGAMYVSVSSFDLFCYHFNHPGTLLDPKKRESTLSFTLGIGAMIEQLFKNLNISSSIIQQGLEMKAATYRGHPGGITDIHEWEHIGIIYLYLITTATTVALSFLNSWHIWLITRGETSIEVHINSSEREKAAQRGMGYNNPYDHGWKNNLRIILGLDGKHGIMSVLMPSRHMPNGDGISWPSNKKPVNYHDPAAYQRYANSKKSKIRKICPCFG